MMRKWLPVDYYIGGNEHARLHLLYTRFITMALCDHAGLKMGDKGDPRDPREPFLKFRAHGMITRGGAKMSKSRGNIINPDEMVGKFGSDTVRMYLMFLGPYAQGGDWQDEAISGIRRFLDRVWRFYFEETAQPGQAAQRAPSDASDRSDASDQSDRADSTSTAEMPKSSLIKLHQTIKKLTEDIEAMSYNTAIAALMECLNALRAGSTGGAANPSGAVSQFARESFCILLAPFAPHLAEEIWSGALGKQPSVASAQWPSFDPALCVEDTVEIAVQINGKIRDRIVIPRDADEATARAAVIAAEKIAPLLAGKTVVKFIYVQNRLANIIIK
ncbi:MAG: class I tRNA ligase family protein [Candidatus Sumerlaeota bacterium]|nr:class I tRNA ligase family protein [Candidatus Sumerlaeota bacterium]